jgi:quinol monooxygenase YgiN
MNTFQQNEHNRRSFLRNAGLLSLSISVPGLLGRHPKTAGAAGHVGAVGATATAAAAAAAAGDAMIEIHPGNKVTVLITVFTLQPENEQKLIELFEEGTSTIFSKQPGYISSSIHRGNDANRLVLYGQWESQESIDAFRKKPEIGPYFQKIKELASFESIVCNDIPFVHHK